VTRAGKTVSRQALARRAEGKPGKRKAPAKKRAKPVSDMERIAERQASRVD
jgi:hypothetical protein